MTIIPPRSQDYPHITELDNYNSRSLAALATCGSFFAKIGQEQEKTEFHSFKLRVGKTFVEQTIAFSNWWNQLETEVQERLTSIDLFYWPIAVAYKLTKLSLKSLEELIKKVNEVTDAEILVANTIEKLIENLQPQKKTKLNLGKSITEEDWLLLEKKLKQDLSNFKRSDITTDEILDRLATQGLEEKASTLLPSKDQLKREKQKREKAEAETNHWREAYNQLRQRIDELNLPVSQLDDPEAIEIEATEIEENSEELLTIAKNSSDSINGDEPVGVSQSTPCVNEAPAIKSPANSIDLSSPETQKLCRKTIGCSVKSVSIDRNNQIIGQVCGFDGKRVQVRIVGEDGRKNIELCDPNTLLFKPYRHGTQYEFFPDALKILSTPQSETKIVDPFDRKRIGTTTRPKAKGFALR